MIFTLIVKAQMAEQQLFHHFSQEARDQAYYWDTNERATFEDARLRSKKPRLRW